MQILVYNGRGVGPGAFLQLFSVLSDFLPPKYQIIPVDHLYFFDKSWEEKTSLIVFPGGRDEPYHSNLQGAGNARIRAYVEKGGRFLGICAGGYYGAASIEFEKGSEIEVCGTRELAFFPGRALGAAYGTGVFEYESEAGSRIAPLQWEGGISPVYFNGGCLFEDPEAFPSTEVVARYDDLPKRPAAIVHCHVGEGRALLSGVHPEYPIEPPFKEKKRKSFWHYLINKILI